MLAQFDVVAAMPSPFLMRVAAGVGCSFGVSNDPDMPPDDACASGPDDYVFTGPYWRRDFDQPGDINYKFVLAHEYGHYVQRKMSGLPIHPYKFAGQPDEPGTPPLCRCDHISGSNALHCLQSREAPGTAQIEGWAQYIAARTWNNSNEANCTHNYYKQVQTNGGVLQPPVPTDCYGAVHWRDSNCFSATRGTEWDWMQFYYRVSVITPNQSTLQDIRQIYLASCGGFCDDNDAASWGSLSLAAANYFGGQGDVRFLNFQARADQTGVDEDQF